VKHEQGQAKLGERSRSMKRVTTFVIAVALVLCMGMASGCREEGTAEKAGEAIDEAFEDAKDEVEKAKKKLD
jgi:hypothetical protein